MSGFELSPELEDFRKVVRDFAEKVIGPHVAEWDKAHHFPVDVVRSMGELGLMGLTAPEEYDKLGWRISDTQPLTFTDCRVPAETCSASAAAASRSSSRSSTTAGWRSPRWPSACSRPAWTSASGTPTNARR